MTREEIFRILDAMKPEIVDIKAYLDRMCGVSPLCLVSQKNGKFQVSNKLENIADIIGIMLSDDKSFLCLRPVTIKDFMTLEKSDEPAGALVQKFIKATYPANSRAATQDDVLQLERDLGKLWKAFSMLIYHGRNELPRLERLGWLDESLQYIEQWEATTKLDYFLEMCGDILVITDYQPSAD